MAMTGGNVGYAALVALSVFVTTSFLAGGALTLIEIAYNTRQTVEMLQNVDANYQQGR